VATVFDAGVTTLPSAAHGFVELPSPEFLPQNPSALSGEPESHIMKTLGDPLGSLAFRYGDIRYGGVYRSLNQTPHFHVAFPIAFYPPSALALSKVHIAVRGSQNCLAIEFSMPVDTS